MSYSDLLKDPRWQRKRLEVLGERDWQCQCCNSKEKTLHVHHKHYRRGAMPWEYEPGELLVLCEQCHEELTAATNLLKRILYTGDMGTVFRVSAYAAAIECREGLSKDLVRVFSGAQCDGVADAFRCAELYGMAMNDVEICRRAKDDMIDVVALAREEDDAMESMIRRIAAAKAAKEEK